MNTNSTQHAAHCVAFYRNKQRIAERDTLAAPAGSNARYIAAVRANQAYNKALDYDLASSR